MPKPKYWTNDGMAYELKPCDRPGYSHGATIPLSYARWIHAHAIVAVERLSAEITDQTGNRLRLKASDGSHLDVHCSWGLAISDGTAADGTPVCLELEEAIFNAVDHIAAWEAAFPSALKVGRPLARVVA